MLFYKNIYPPIHIKYTKLHNNMNKVDSKSSSSSRPFTNVLPFTLNDHLSKQLPKYENVSKQVKVSMANTLFLVVLIDIIPTALDFFQIVRTGERFIIETNRKKCFVIGQGLSILVSSYVITYGNLISNFYLIFAGCVSLICRSLLIAAYLKHSYCE